MKTEEDEAFEAIERRQGGFQAKRAMAADKLQDEADMLTIAYLDGYDKGKKAALAQPAQEPVAWTLLLTDEHHGIIGAAGEKFIGAPEHYKRVDVYTAPPQSAQEPVAYVTGMSFGRFIVEPLNPAMVLPVGMALYFAPQGNT